MSSTYRVYERKKGDKSLLKPKPKKISQERVTLLVREIILGIRAMGDQKSVTAEDIASDLRCEVHKVVYALHRMNLDGWVSQKIRNFAHDTNRNPVFYGPSSGWAANTYDVIIPKTYDIPIRTDLTVLGPDAPRGTIVVFDERPGFLKKPRFSKRLQKRFEGKEDVV